ncbi:MAG: hypothetical protein PHQ75_12105 [Thermoguttaceae bacterium]|nr:hypothetical protein [Thermoguttaceae bacterium]
MDGVKVSRRHIGTGILSSNLQCGCIAWLMRIGFTKNEWSVQYNEWCHT